MGEAAKTVTLVIKDHIKPFLQQQGFKKKANSFWQNSDAFCDVINIQLSQTNVGPTGSFAINLGVYWREVQRLLGQEAKAFPPKEYECTMKQRLGVLVTGLDHWWDVDQSTDLDLLGQEVVAALSTYGLPWFKECHDPAHFIEQASRKHEYLSAAVWCLMHGDRTAAEQFLQKGLRDKPLGRYWIERQAQRIGLIDEIESNN
jgi:hypothetical protein